MFDQFCYFVYGHRTTHKKKRGAKNAQKHKLTNTSKKRKPAAHSTTEQQQLANVKPGNVAY